MEATSSLDRKANTQLSNSSKDNIEASGLIPKDALDLEESLDRIRAASTEVKSDQILDEAQNLQSKWPVDLVNAVGKNPAQEQTVDSYLRQIAEAERKFGCNEEPKKIQTSMMHEERFDDDDEDGIAAALNVVALKFDEPKDNEFEPSDWHILAKTSWDLATRAIAFQRGSCVILACVDDTYEDFEDSPTFQASLTFVQEFIEQKLNNGWQRLVMSGHGRGGRLAAALASRLTDTLYVSKLVVFNTCPHHVTGRPDFVVYTGAPRLDLCSPRAKGAVTCLHYRLVDVDRSKRWPLRCFLGSASRLATITTLSVPIAKVPLLTAEISGLVARSASTAYFATEATKLVLSQKNYFGNEPPFSREARQCDVAHFADLLYFTRTTPKRIQILYWPNLYDQLRDLAFDLLRSELLLFHPANAGLHTLIKREAAYNAWLQRRSGYKESNRVQERHRRQLPILPSSSPSSVQSRND